MSVVREPINILFVTSIHHFVFPNFFHKFFSFSRSSWKRKQTFHWSKTEEKTCFGPIKSMISLLRKIRGKKRGKQDLLFGGLCRIHLLVRKYDWDIWEWSKMFFEIKVRKFQKQILLFWFEPKNKQNNFLISALASKMGEIKKIMARHHAN